MLRNYLKAAWRNLRKHKMHTLINIAGLSMGMAVAILIGLWIHSELSFDKSFQNYDRIARVIQNVTNNGEIQTWTAVPYPLAEEIRKNYGSDFKQVVMSTYSGDHILTSGDKKLTRSGRFFEDGVMDLLGVKMISGSKNSMQEPNSILISASTARAYFGEADPLDKMMKLDNQMDVKVTGVYEDFPNNSSFADLQFITTWSLLYNQPDGIKTMTDPWRPNSFELYVILNENANFASASARIRDAKLKKVNEQLAKKKPLLFLHPMRDWHLYSEFRNGVNAGGGIQYVWMFGIIGVFVLLLACINFMNLSTARSEKRAREVGIRKTIGSLRRQLIFQFICESALIASFSLILSLPIVKLVLPGFNEVARKEIAILWNEPAFWLLLMGFALITGLIAGSYPAFYLSSFKPIKVLKGTFKAGRLAEVPRKTLVVLQFTVSITLIIGTIIVYRQIQFAKDRPVGYSRANLISIYTATPEIHQHFEAVQRELKEKGIIESIAESGSPTTSVWSSSSGFDWKGKDPNLSIDFKNVDVSYDYGKTIGWEIKEGRDFSRDFATDSTAFIINEAAAKYIGFRNPIGETVKWWGNPFQIIGVIKDMVMESPYEPSKPTFYFISNNPGGVVFLKLNPALSVKKAMSNAEPIFRKFSPAQPFYFKLVDEEYAQKFGEEERIGKLAGFFALLAILISCLGLFGLASFVAEQRTREIGIRKVLGASIANVWHLLSKEFILLVSFSFLIAAPVSYYFMHNWLQQYEFRTGMPWWIFVISGLGAVMITVLVISIQAIKAAVANPIRSLRTE